MSLCLCMYDFCFVILFLYTDITAIINGSIEKGNKYKYDKSLRDRKENKYYYMLKILKHIN